jgi:hypothetical protein
VSRRPDHRHGGIRRRTSVLALATSAFLSLSCLACMGGSGSTGAQVGTTGSVSITAGTATTPSVPALAIPVDASADDFDVAFFDPARSFVVDNQWLPLEPGTRWVHHGWTDEEGEKLPHSIVFTVTDLVKEIDGVRTLVGWDRDFSDGKLVEAELIFLAQDRAGNVWHFGQYSEGYDEEGEFEGGQAWLAGRVDGAKPGIIMKADPRLGTPAYSEGFAPSPYEWDDWGKVDKVGVSTCVPVDCYDDVLVIDEFEPQKPGAHQLKYYARGVGNVRTGWRGNDPEKEVLTLARIIHLSPAQLDQARGKARALEARASVYGGAPSAEVRPTGT